MVHLPPQIGDVLIARKEWGRLPTSVRDCCPVCRRFVCKNATSCTSCGAAFKPVADGVVEVISLGR